MASGPKNLVTAMRRPPSLEQHCSSADPTRPTHSPQHSQQDTPTQTRTARSAAQPRTSDTAVVCHASHCTTLSAHYQPVVTLCYSQPSKSFVDVNCHSLVILSASLIPSSPRHCCFLCPCSPLPSPHVIRRYRLAGWPVTSLLPPAVPSSYLLSLRPLSPLRVDAGHAQHSYQ